jgi:hypothetical protein
MNCFQNHVKYKYSYNFYFIDVKWEAQRVILSELIDIKCQQ